MRHKVIGSSSQLMGKNAESFSFSMLLSKSGKQFLAAGIVSEKENCRFGECPFQVNVADLFAAEAKFFSGRFLGAFHESAVGGKVLNPRES